MSRNAFATLLVGLIFGSALLFLLYSLFTASSLSNNILVSAVPAVLFGILFVVQLCGWRYVPQVFVTALVIAIILGATPSYLLVSALVAAVAAAALLPPAWSIGAFAVAVLGGLISIAARQSSFAPDAVARTVNFVDVVLFSMVAIGIFTASSLAWGLQRQATESARRAQEERDQVELKSRELSEANHQLNDQIEQQRRLLDLVATLETPAVQLADGILFTPIVGHIDTRRAQDLTTRLLKDVNSKRARLVILDISGVSVMDTNVAQALLNTAKALRLLGCDVAFSGISASVALTLTDLGINLDEVKTVRSPQEAMQLFSVGATISNGKVAIV